MKKIFTVIVIFILVNNLSAQKRPDHIVVLMLENHGYSQIIGSSLAPYINGLKSDSYTALMTKSFGLTHPSQPNYIMLFSGSNQGVVDDNLPTNTPFTTANLGASLIAKGFTFIGYSESLPSVGFTGKSSGNYARKHSPWANWQGTGTNGIASSLHQPFSSFPTNYNNLPTVSFVIPNLADDMHDSGTTGIATTSGDTWVKNNLNSYVQWCKTNNSLLILTFDEDDDTPVNQITTMIIGQDINGGSYNQAITHYNVLRTIEDLYGLPYAGSSKDSSFINKIWKTVTPVVLTHFNVHKVNNENVLEWATASEENGACFIVESSIDGKEFNTVSKVAVKGNNSTYTLVDNNELAKYYRLKIINLSGDSRYSEVITVPENKNTSLFKLVPNPAVKNTTIYFNQPVSNATISVMNMEGRNLFEDRIITSTNKYLLSTDKLLSGNYIVYLKTATSGFSQKLMIVQ